MRIEGAVALVTGAGRGLGRELAGELARRGARTVYGAARNPDDITDPGIVPVRLDITDPGAVTLVARQVADAVEAGQIEVLADERTRRIKASLSRDHELIYPEVQARWDRDHPAERP